MLFLCVYVFFDLYLAWLNAIPHSALRKLKMEHVRGLRSIAGFLALGGFQFSGAMSDVPVPVLFFLSEPGSSEPSINKGDFSMLQFALLPSLETRRTKKIRRNTGK